MQGCQVVHGLEVDGVVLVTAFAWTGNLHNLSKDPDGTAHHFKWQVGDQHVVVRNGYMQGSTTADKDRLEQTLGTWLEEAAVSGEPTLVLGDFNATKAELGITQWFDLPGWHDLGGAEQLPTCLPSRGQARRIDWAWASKGVQPALRGTEVRWDLGLRPHAAQQFSLELQEKRWFNCWQGATPLPGLPCGAQAAAY